MKMTKVLKGYKVVNTPISDAQFTRMLNGDWYYANPKGLELYKEAEALVVKGYEVKIYRTTTAIRGHYRNFILYRYVE